MAARSYKCDHLHALVIIEQRRALEPEAFGTVRGDIFQELVSSLTSNLNITLILRSASGFCSKTLTSRRIVAFTSMASNAGSGSASSNSGGSQKGVSSTESKPVSDYSIHKSWGGTQNFYHSWGLKMYDPDDYAEGQAITEAFKAADAQRKSSGSKSRGRASR